MVDYMEQDQDLIDILNDIGQPLPEDDTPTDNQPEETSEENNEDNGEATPPEDEVNDTEQEESNSAPPQPNYNTKQNQAFAQLRVQNQQYQRTMQALGQLLGAQTQDPQQLYNLVQEKIIQAQAKQQGVPEQFLRDFQAMKQEAEDARQERAYQQGLLSFQKVKNKFDLTDKELNEFTDTLISRGINPFVQKVNLESQYKDIYFDKLVEKKVQKALEEERDRASKATNNSATPPKKSGGKPNQSDFKINSQSDFEKWLNDNTTE